MSIIRTGSRWVGSPIGFAVTAFSVHVAVFAAAVRFWGGDEVLDALGFLL